jgi:uncharacterized protein with von Willebrand factor type A (vWA) domain
MTGEHCLQKPIRLEPVGDADGGVMAANVIEFGRLLRRAGLDIDPGQTAAFLKALTFIGMTDRSDVRVAGRTIFVRRREDQPVYEAAFDLFWRRPGGPHHLTGQLPRIRQSSERGSPGDTAPPNLATNSDRVASARALAASATEVLRTADFASLTSEESRDAEAMLAALRPRLSMRRARRSRVEQGGHRPAARFMLRWALGTGGEALRWKWLRRTLRPRPLVLVCDISGSMEWYSRFMLRFAHALGRTGAPVEVFVFGTRLTRITRQLATRSADVALQRVGAKVVDWKGGTRIGESLRELNQRWVRRTVRSGALVLLVSDGWERGDPAVLAREMARLRRSCHRLIWLDPLASKAGFEPSTLGLKAALPFVDHFVPCGSVASLEQLAERLALL